MLNRLRTWLRRDPDTRVREALRTGRREWPMPDGSTLRLLSTEEELRMTPAQRWARHNAEARAVGCRCGRPGKLVRSYPVDGGSYEVYACDDHADVTSWHGELAEDGAMVWTPGQRGGMS